MIPDQDVPIYYDAEPLFTDVSVRETIECILHEMYLENKLHKPCSKLMFKHILVKLTTEKTFTLNSKC